MDEYRYRYELHVHNSLCSACAHNSPEEMVEAYLQKGYAGMVFTDHFLKGNSAVDRSLPWAEKMRCYDEAVQRGARYAYGQDFAVLFGLEHHYGDGKEVLTYGIDLDFLLRHPDIDRLPLPEYARLVHEAGGVLSMAHPFRRAPYINADVLPQADCLDAAELFNFSNTGEENKEAAVFIEENGLLATSGGDVHRVEEPAVGMAGIALREKVYSGKELVKVLKSGDYRLIVNGEIVKAF